MPRRDGNGPMAGRNFGLCTGANAVRYGSGFGMGLGFSGRRGFGGGSGRGFGRDFAVNQTSAKTQKELLKEQKDILQNRLEAIDKQLENL